MITDVERIAPCLPGAQLQEIEGDVYRGVVKVKLGSITPQFKGQATFVERDDDDPPGRAQGRGPRHGRPGQRRGRRSPPRPRASRRRAPSVIVTTDLHITGKVAQFGRGIIGDVCKKLMAQFASNLNTMLDEQPTPTAGRTRRPPAGAARRRRRRAAHPADRGEAAATGGPAVPEPATATRPARRSPSRACARSTARPPSRRPRRRRRPGAPQAAGARRRRCCSCCCSSCADADA